MRYDRLPKLPGVEYYSGKPMIHRFSLNICLGILILFPVLSISGCGAVIVGGAAAVGTVAYFQGDLHAVLEGSLKQSITAVDAAILRAGFDTITRSVDNLGGYYKLHTHQEEKIEITLKKVDNRATDILIRVGLFGDETLSHKILEEIQKGI